MSDIHLKFEGYTAGIRVYGAGLNFLKFRERDLVEPFTAIQPTKYQGDVLAPWPNRIRDGRYIYRNRLYQAPVNEVSRKNALHGLVNNRPWEIDEIKSHEVKMKTTLLPDDSYPGQLELSICYTLSSSGLKIEISAKNIGINAAPYGVSIHPYLVADSSTKVDEWNLQLFSHQYFKVDPERLLPISIEETPVEFDFVKSQKIRKTFIDHAFLVGSESFLRGISVTAPNGNGVEMRHSENLGWVQIHTADRDGGADSRRCLAVEPMTCPPDAFNSGIDVIDLEPGQSNLSYWVITAI